MNLVERIIRKHLEREHQSVSLEQQNEEVARAETINALPLDEFHTLSQEDQEFAEEVWAARVVEVNVKRQAERRTRLIEERLALSAG